MIPSRLQVVPALLLCLLSVGCVSPNPRRDRDQAEAMEAVVRAQEAAWNRGDLDGYMSSGYLRSDDLTFFSEGDVTRGYDTVLDRYRSRYQGAGREMGRLAFSGLETLLYGRDVGVVRGDWKLEFLDGRSVAGLFTLVMRRTSEGWRIVHDHTSVGARE